jgi:hypothetical protein
MLGTLDVIITNANVDAELAARFHPTVVKVDARNRRLVPAGG